MGVREAAEYLDVSVAWLYRNATRSGLIAYKFGVGRNAKIRFKISEVETWVKQQKVGDF
ncbi:helix-turn-helix domain-containing protein [Streptomyces sp. NPDC002742]|uniref:helix-turn-helix domain-containing protein n=1 Tax=Streptomyces sp. NPDC002742 TaxID=3364663 RepID=UPI00368CDA76